METFWLSFVDPDELPGSRFLGVCIVEAEDFGKAIATAWERSCNPGGQVEVINLTECGHKIKPEFFNRLLTKDEAQSGDYYLQETFH